MERESGSNNGTPRFRPVRLFGVEITLPENGDNRQQPTELQVHSLTISQISNLRDINSFGPSGTMVVEQPEQVENGLREATGGNIDPDMVDAVIQITNLITDIPSIR
nr:E3 ubiquitin-protein ligase RNF12-like [Ipomoea batatas]